MLTTEDDSCAAVEHELYEEGRAAYLVHDTEQHRL